MRIIWIDDYAKDSSLGRIWDALERASEDPAFDMGGEPAAMRCVDVDQFLLECEKTTYDLAVIDYKIPPTTGEIVASRLLARSGSIRIIFLSAWVAQFNPVRNLDPRATFTTLAKPIVAESDEDWYARLTVAIKYVLGSALVDWVGFECDVESVPCVSDRHALDSLDFHEQMSSVDELTRILETTYDDVFGTTSATWLVVTWPTGGVARWGEIDDPMPTEEEREDIEESFDELSLVISKPLHVEEVGGTWSSCRPGPNGDSDLYPSLRMELPGWMGYLNVDTGSVASFISYERLVASTGVSWLPTRNRYSWSPERILVGPSRREFRPVSAVVDQQAEVDSRDGTVSVRVRLRVVDPFYGTGVAKTCRVGNCEGSSLRKDGLYWCGHRAGLLGRDLLRLNQLRLVFDSIAKRCYVEVSPAPAGGAVSEESRSAASFIMLGSDLD